MEDTFELTLFLYWVSQTGVAFTLELLGSYSHQNFSKVAKILPGHSACAFCSNSKGPWWHNGMKIRENNIIASNKFRVTTSCDI